MISKIKWDRKQLGSSTVEYALVMAVVSLMIVGSSGVMNEPLKQFFGCAIQSAINTMGTERTLDCSGEQGSDNHITNNQ